MKKWLKSLFSGCNNNSNAVEDTRRTQISTPTEVAPTYNTHAPEQVSEYYYNQHIGKIAKFIYTRPIATDVQPFTSLQKAFLKYIAGKEITCPAIAGYWTHQYNIDYNYLLSKAFNMGYLEAGNISCILDSLTLSDLKAILKHNKLSVSGKKQELVNRIQSEISTESIDAFFANKTKMFVLTDSGMKLISDLKDSITKDTDFEDQVLSVIQTGDFHKAFSLVADWEAKKPIPRGLNIDWHTITLSASELQNYKALSNKFDNKTASCHILADMLGCPAGLDKLLSRIFQLPPKTITSLPILYTSEECEKSEQLFFSKLFLLMPPQYAPYISRKRMSDGCLNVSYKQMQIGRVYFKSKGFSMQILQGNLGLDVVWLKNCTLKEMISNLPKWVKYIKTLDAL